MRGLAEEFGAILVDLQGAFDEMLRVYHPAAIAADRVHPNQMGHMVMARAFLNSVGFEW